MTDTAKWYKKKKIKRFARCDVDLFHQIFDIVCTNFTLNGIFCSWTTASNGPLFTKLHHRFLLERRVSFLSSVFLLFLRFSTPNITRSCIFKQPHRSMEFMRACVCVRACLCKCRQSATQLSSLTFFFWQCCAYIRFRFVQNGLWTLWNQYSVENVATQTNWCYSNTNLKTDASHATHIHNTHMHLLFCCSSIYLYNNNI